MRSQEGGEIGFAHRMMIDFFTYPDTTTGLRNPMTVQRMIKNLLISVSPSLGRQCVRLVQSIRACRNARIHASSRLSRRSVSVVTPGWRARIEDVKSAPDNAYISRVADAGVLRDGWVTMHNGIEVKALGYYGAGVLNMLIENKGVHEPQEERAFANVLGHVGPKSTMLELGAPRVSARTRL